MSKQEIHVYKQELISKKCFPDEVTQEIMNDILIEEIMRLNRRIEEVHRYRPLNSLTNNTTWGTL